MKTKTMQRRKLKALPQKYEDNSPPVTESNNILSRTKARQPDLADTPRWHVLYPPPCTLMGASHTYFPRCVPRLMEHSWKWKAPTPNTCKPWTSETTFTQMETRGFPASSGVRYTHPQPERQAHVISVTTCLSYRLIIMAATRLIVFFLEQSWKSLKGQ